MALDEVGSNGPPLFFDLWLLGFDRQQHRKFGPGIPQAECGSIIALPHTMTGGTEVLDDFNTRNPLFAFEWI
jgi:hypothetical protein